MKMSSFNKIGDELDYQQFGINLSEKKCNVPTLKVQITDTLIP